MITVIGIKSCDTCRKALAYLKAKDIPHKFHDLRADGLDESSLLTWLDAVGWEVLLNRRSTTWRGLSDADKADMTTSKAKRLLTEHPTLIKRPVFEAGDQVYVGFSADVQKALIS